MRNIMKILALCLVALPAFALGAESPTPTPAASSCTTTREYVTTLEFIRSRKDIGIPENAARDTALKVAKGCSGAANRFIKVTGVLLQAEASPSDALHAGVTFAEKTDSAAETFLAIFKSAFLADALDLDLRNALKLAQSITAEFDGSMDALNKDFHAILHFCTSTKDLGLPKPQCGDFTAKVLRSGKAWPRGLSTAFLESMTLLRNPKGPNLTTGKALEITQQLLVAGPGSVQNFVDAFRYAGSPKGLDLERGKALEFALPVSYTHLTLPTIYSV